MKYKISKRFSDSVKATDGTLKSFTTELSVDIEADSAEALIAESDKLFAQVKWLVEHDEEKIFGTGV